MVIKKAKFGGKCTCPDCQGKHIPSGVAVCSGCGEQYGLSGREGHALVARSMGECPKCGTVNDEANPIKRVLDSKEKVRD